MTETYPDQSGMTPVARVVSPYREKFGIPRQPGLVPAAKGYLQMLPGFDDPRAFEGLHGFSHLWVIFGFHQCQGKWRSRVRPPRLGGNRELGVFATRSPFRPNNLGLSVLTFDGLQQLNGELRLNVSGLDMQHGTPVYDIKPYVPYTDSVPNALGGFASEQPVRKLDVAFSHQAENSLLASSNPAQLRELISQSLALDPRPAYRQEQAVDRVYGMRLDDYDVRWRVQDGVAIVDEILPIR